MTKQIRTYGILLLCRFGGPVWWNTPLEDDGSGAADNRTTWAQRQPPVQEGGFDDGLGDYDAGSGPPRGGGGGASGSGAGRKRVPEERGGADEEDELPDAVKRRLEAMKQGTKTLD